MKRAVGTWRFFIRKLLKIIRQDECGYAALAKRDANCAIEEVSDLGGHPGLLDESASDIAEHRWQVDPCW